MSDDKYEVTVVGYSDVAWCDSKHLLLGMNIHLSDNSIIPYAYRVDGEEDNDGFICQAVKHDYISGNFTEINECPDWKIQLEKEVLSLDVRLERNNLLSNTDHLIQSDYPISDEKKQEIKVYRQALRDIPQQDGFPDSIVWPDKPTI